MSPSGVGVMASAGCFVQQSRCNWRGDYDSMARISALKCRRTALTVRDSSFVTLNARAIRAQLETLTVKSSTFTHCGHAELYGGAIWHSDEERSIADCRFDRCVAALGGALRFNTARQSSIANCKFLYCKSTEQFKKTDPSENNIAVFINDSRSYTMHNCTFESNHLLIIDPSDASVTNSFFQRSGFYMLMSYEGATKSSGCTFNEGIETWLSSKEINFRATTSIKYPAVFSED